MIDFNLLIGKISSSKLNKHYAMKARNLLRKYCSFLWNCTGGFCTRFCTT